MSQQDLLKRIVAALERTGIDYMITGSIASSLQGEPRATHDMDVVVELDESSVSAPEDTILQKRRWAALSGGSEKLYGDALAVYEVQHARLDQNYLAKWAKLLGAESQLARIRREADPI